MLVAAIFSIQKRSIGIYGFVNYYLVEAMPRFQHCCLRQDLCTKMIVNVVKNRVLVVVPLES